MSRRTLFFVVPAVLVALAVLRIGTIPLAILYGKVPDASFSMALRIAGPTTLPILLVGTAMITLAWRIFARRGPPQRWILLLLAAPVVSFVMLYVTL